ncbi:hypothetical protein HBB16_18855 [Pseudonocardia sp. MCCB 268]|nr:hypothetical protein [Pseudonocardia cytotoxica]
MSCGRRRDDGPSGDGQVDRLRLAQAFTAAYLTLVPCTSGCDAGGAAGRADRPGVRRRDRPSRRARA